MTGPGVPAPAAPLPAVVAADDADADDGDAADPAADDAVVPAAAVVAAVPPLLSPPQAAAMKPTLTIPATAEVPHRLVVKLPPVACFLVAGRRPHGGQFCRAATRPPPSRWRRCRAALRGSEARPPARASRASSGR